MGFAIVYCLAVIACFGGISDLYAVAPWFGHLGWLLGLLLLFWFLYLLLIVLFTTPSYYCLACNRCLGADCGADYVFCVLRSGC